MALAEVSHDKAKWSKKSLSPLVSFCLIMRGREGLLMVYWGEEKKQLWGEWDELCTSGQTSTSKNVNRLLCQVYLVRYVFFTLCSTFLLLPQSGAFSRADDWSLVIFCLNHKHCVKSVFKPGNDVKVVYISIPPPPHPILPQTLLSVLSSTRSQSEYFF